MRTMVGERYGKLTVQSRSGVNHEGRVQWSCLCDCGGTAIVAGTSLRLGMTRSCGCLRSDVKRTHGLSKTPTYSSWIAMIHRCENPKRRDYSYYGARGVRVCARWHVFENFLADMGERPSRTATIERTNNRKGYTPSNCVWADRTAQARNTRRNTLLTYNGETLTIAAWAERVGRPHSTLSWRKQQGWCDAEIINGRRK